MMKVKMKISGAFRTFDAAQDFATLRSVIATARQQGWNILQTLTPDASNLTLTSLGVTRDALCSSTETSLAIIARAECRGMRSRKIR